MAERSLRRPTGTLPNLTPNHQTGVRPDCKVDEVFVRRGGFLEFARPPLGDELARRHRARRREDLGAGRQRRQVARSVEAASVIAA